MPKLWSIPDATSHSDLVIVLQIVTSNYVHKKMLNNKLITDNTGKVDIQNKVCLTEE